MVGQQNEKLTRYSYSVTTLCMFHTHVCMQPYQIHLLFNTAAKSPLMISFRCCLTGLLSFLEHFFHQLLCMVFTEVCPLPNTCHVLAHFLDALISFEQCKTYSTPCTATIFATYPQSYLSLANGFLDQV